MNSFEETVWKCAPLFVQLAPSSDTEPKLAKHPTAPKVPDGCANPSSWPRSTWNVIRLWPSALLLKHIFNNTCPPLGAAWDEMTTNSISMKRKHSSLQQISRHWNQQCPCRYQWVNKQCLPVATAHNYLSRSGWDGGRVSPSWTIHPPPVKLQLGLVCQYRPEIPRHHLLGQKNQEV